MGLTLSSEQDCCFRGCSPPHRPNLPRQNHPRLGLHALRRPSDFGMNHGGIECRSDSNSLECALGKREKAIIRGTDPLFESESPFEGEEFFSERKISLIPSGWAVGIGGGAFELGGSTATSSGDRCGSGSKRRHS